jgi:hypothetical protein
MQLHVLHTESQRCVWCGAPRETDDHVFPRSLGGTKELVVPACRNCQKEISRAEGEVARRSLFALHRIEQGPPPRDKKRADSGSVEAKYVLVKDERLGGYIEVAFRSKQHPITLPCIEIDVNTGRARKRGVRPEDVDALVEAILRVVVGPPDESGQLGSVDVDLLSEAEAHYADDPDWWPRAFLDLRGRLQVRARDAHEAEQFFPILITLAERGVFSDHSRWSTGEVVAGTTHRFRLEWDDLAVARVVAKIAYATAVRSVLPSELRSEPLTRVSRFVRGGNDEDAVVVRSIREAGTITEWPDHHLALLESNGGRLQGIVVLYGACFVVDLGDDPLPEAFSKPVLAMSLTNGTKTYFASDDEAEAIARRLKDYIRA